MLFTLIISAFTIAILKAVSEWVGFGSQSTLSRLRCKLNVMQTSCNFEKKVKMAASRAVTLLRYFKRGREDEENASNTGDSQPTRLEMANKDRDFKPAWKRILCGL